MGLNPANTLLASGSFDETVKVWDVASKNLICSVTIGSELGDQQLGVCWSNNGQIVSVSLDGSLNYIDESSGSVSRKVTGHVNAISSLARLADGSFIAGSGFSGDVYRGVLRFLTDYMYDFVIIFDFSDM